MMRGWWECAYILGRCFVGILLCGLALWQLIDKRGFFVPWMMWTGYSLMGIAGFGVFLIAAEEWCSG